MAISVRVRVYVCPPRHRCLVNGNRLIMSGVVFVVVVVVVVGAVQW